MNWRTFFYDALVFALIATAALFVWVVAAHAKCGEEYKTQTGWVSVVCVDYPAIRAKTGSTMFPDVKGQQVWVTSNDATVKGFRVVLRYRENGAAREVIQYTDRHPVYASGASWLLGDVDIVGVTVTEVREAISYVF